MLIVVISATIDWFTSTITTEQQNPPLPRGWWEHRIFWWERQNSSWMLMPISKNRSSGYPAAFTASSFTNRCFACHHNRAEWVQPHHLPGPEGAIAGMRPGGQNPLPWSSLVPTLCIRSLRTCIGMCTNSGGYPEEAMEECLCLEVLDSIKECLWLKWLSAQPEVEQKQLLANAPQPDSCTEVVAANHSTYEKFTAVKQDSYEEMMALVRDAQWWTLVAAAPFEERWKGWATPLAADAQLATDTPAASDEGGPGPQDIWKAP